MSDLQRDIEAYEREQAQLEATAMGKWVLFNDAALICVVDTFEEVAERAVRDYGSGPYLIRQVGASRITMPASVLYRVG
jgi:hypothetical protein